MKPIKKIAVLLIDILLSPIALISAVFSQFITTHKLPFAEKIFFRFGVMPVADHYYQPLINPRKYLTKPLDTDRELPGIDLNTRGQLDLLASFNYAEELLALPVEKTAKREFYFNIPAFGPGDSEYLYNIVRHIKPLRVLEIGSGSSTLMTLRAIEKNHQEDPGLQTKLICVEPYENDWLEQTGAEIIRDKVEALDPSFFQVLQENDILFIDSSHIIRPQGDVLFLYQNVLPLLNPGVYVHIHDIFSPKDYLTRWILDDRKLWNEQYLLEAFLTLNKDFEIVGALNFLQHNYPAELHEKCPVIASRPGTEPGSFWLKRIRGNASAAT